MCNGIVELDIPPMFSIWLAKWPFMVNAKRIMAWHKAPRPPSFHFFEYS